MRRVAWVVVLVLALAGCTEARGRISEFPNPNRDYSRRLADAPFPAHTGSIFVAAGGKLLLLGGTRYVDCEGMMSCPIGDEISAMVVYDPERDQWSRLPDLPRALVPQPQVATLGDRLIATNGGHVLVFDLSAQRWTEYPPPPIDPANADHLLAHGHSVYALTDPSNPRSPVQQLDLRTGSWSVLTRKGLGAATTRSIFWTEAGLVSAGYDSSSGTPIPALAKYADGTWHRYPAPPIPVSPAPYVLWGAMIVIAAPPGGAAQGLDPGPGTWIRVPGGLAQSIFLDDGRPAIPQGGPGSVVLFNYERLYMLNGRSQLREQPFGLA